MVSVTLGVADVGASADAYARNFGLRVLREGDAEAREAHPRAGRAGGSAVLAFAPAHASTVLVLEQQPPPPPSRAPPPPASPPVVELALQDLDTAYHHVVGSGWAASALEAGPEGGAGGASFTCADPDGNVFHCTALPAA